MIIVEDLLWIFKLLKLLRHRFVLSFASVFLVLCRLFVSKEVIVSRFADSSSQIETWGVRKPHVYLIRDGIDTIIIYNCNVCQSAVCELLILWGWLLKNK